MAVFARVFGGREALRIGVGNRHRGHSGGELLTISSYILAIAVFSGRTRSCGFGAWSELRTGCTMRIVLALFCLLTVLAIGPHLVVAPTDAAESVAVHPFAELLASDCDGGGQRAAPECDGFSLHCGQVVFCDADSQPFDLSGAVAPLPAVELPPGLRYSPPPGPPRAVV
jgi:hypothetical protein